jgi:beta-aspartyl-peptidase (threonine type)
MRKVSEIIRVLLLLVVATLPSSAMPATGENADVAESSEAPIRAELEQQVAAWNHCDLKGYMNGYWHSPELTFFAGSQKLSGWEAAYQRYRAAYKDKEMGRLEFTNIHVEMLCPDAALVRGGWQLTMKDRSKRHGLFTLVLKKFDEEGWRIIHDHSS